MQFELYNLWLLILLYPGRQITKKSTFSRVKNAQFNALKIVLSRKKLIDENYVFKFVFLKTKIFLTRKTVDFFAS